WLMIQNMLLAQPSFFNPSNFSNGLTRLLILEGKLIDLYLDTINIIQSTSDVASTLHLYHTAAGALAALTWLRQMGNHENLGMGRKQSLGVGGTNIYNAGPIVLEKMENL